MCIRDRFIIMCLITQCEEAMKPHIIVSDNDNTSARLITAILGEEGYRVSRAVDGAECLLLARAEAPDLIILDLLIPRIHGLTVLEELKAAGLAKDYDGEGEKPEW